MDRIREIIAASTLTDGQKSLLLLTLEKGGEDMQKTFVEEFSEHVDELPAFFSDIQEKVDARDDPEALGRIYEREKEYLKTLAKE